MMLDDKLTMNDYLDGIWKKTNAKIGILSKVRRFISLKTATRIYKCMIRPHLDYVDYVIDSGSADRVHAGLSTVHCLQIERTLIHSRTYIKSSP